MNKKVSEFLVQIAWFGAIAGIFLLGWSGYDHLKGYPDFTTLEHKVYSIDSSYFERKHIRRTTYYILHMHSSEPETWIHFKQKYWLDTLGQSLARSPELHVWINGTPEVENDNGREWQAIPDGMIYQFSGPSGMIMAYKDLKKSKRDNDNEMGKLGLVLFLVCAPFVGRDLVRIWKES